MEVVILVSFGKETKLFNLLFFRDNNRDCSD